MTTTTFQNGQVLTSSALTDSNLDAIFQLLCCKMLGLTAGLQLSCQLSDSSNTITSHLLAANVKRGFQVSGPNIPEGAVIVGITTEGTNLLIELSVTPTLNGLQMLSFFDPAYNTRVRTSWQEKGAPGFAIEDDTLFIRCVLEPTTYNVRDESWSVLPGTEGTTLSKNRTYTRQWRIAFVAYGPNACDSVRLIRSMLLEDFPHDTLAGSNLYLVPDTVTPDRSPELYESQWWERWDWAAIFNEQVNESITIPKVATIPVIGSTSNRQTFGASIQGG
jgi:hypothetical protein